MVVGVKAHLMRWATGLAMPGRVVGEEAPQASETIVLESPDHLPAVVGSGLVGPQTMVFVPGDGTQAGSGAGAGTLVRYGGSLSEPGAEFSLEASFYLQIQNYSTSPYMSMFGPTLIRVTDECDFDVYLADADEAKKRGDFADFLTTPLVQVADLPALGAAGEDLGPRLRVHVNRVGELSTSPAGRSVGRVGDGLDMLTTEWARVNSATAHACGVCLDRAVPEDVRAQALAQRPWLGRYIVALAALRDLRARGISGLRVSGFGGRLVPDLEGCADAAEAAGAAVPLLLWADERAYLHRADLGRTFQLDLDAARLAEILLVSGSLAAAAPYAAVGPLRQVMAVFDKRGLPLVAPVPVRVDR